jgi:putative PEP-CTERM system histidine kinase
MTIYPFISYIAAFFCGCLAVFIFIKDRQSFVHRTFVIGMITLGIEAVFRGLSLRAFLPEEIIRWQRTGFYTTAFLPGIWLVFSLSFSRTVYKKYLLKWRWVILLVFIIPLFLAIGFNKSFFKELPIINEHSGWLLPLGWSGYLFHILFLMATILILTNLESTLRASSGAIRWQIKFMVLGLGSIFAIRIFTTSQALLFHSVNASIEMFQPMVLILGNTLIIISLIRSRFLSIDIYLSETILFRSFTVLIAGIYLFTVGILAKLISYFNSQSPFLVDALFIFLAFLGLSILLLSNELRQRIKGFIHLHLKRPRYDYREEWTSFTKQTASLLNIKELCTVVARMVSETFGVSSATIWLIDKVEEKLIPISSTTLSETQIRLFEGIKISENFIDHMRSQRAPIDLEQSGDRWTEEIKRSYLDLFRDSKIRYVIPLSAGNEFLGLLTLNERLRREPFVFEDFELLNTFADQMATNMLNLKLSENLQEKKQWEALQTMSAFMIHDLKNLASTLSLTVQNLPIHFDNPEFQDDALMMMKQSVNKINSMCRNLSILSQKIELKKVETDLNQLVNNSLCYLNGSSKVSLIQDLSPMPKLVIDPEQVQKVLINLILNAKEAVGNGGEIRLSTQQRDSWVILVVSDSGCGMSKEFMEQSLFHPFKTTKKEGMGIGLFQSKMIVEAHQGRIEVESELGKGSTFKIFLPIDRE